MIDFAISLAAGIVLFFLGYGSNRLKRWIFLRSLRKIWKHFLKAKKIVVVITTRPGPQPKSTPRISFNEMEAFVKISRTLNSFGVETLPVDSQIRLHDLEHKDIIILGGPASNQISNEIWNRISNKIPFVFNLSNHSIMIGERNYVPIKGQDGKLTRDYGLIARLSNPLNTDRSIILCFGCHGFGTYGTVKLITERALSRELLINVGKADNYIALAEFKLQKNVIVSTKIVECYILTK